MGTTPLFNLPFPDGPELIDAAQIAALAGAVDSALATFTTPTQHVINLGSGWESNSQVPLTVYRFGVIVIVTGEIFRTGTSTNNNVGTLPVQFRPSLERIRIPTVRTGNWESEGNKPAIFEFSETGAITATGISNVGVTPGYGINGIWVADS